MALEYCYSYIKAFVPTTELAVATLKGHSDLVTSFCWSRDGKLIATASLDRSIRVYYASTLKSATPK